MKETEFDQLNVVPLVDVMLVLLTIVLTTATFIVQGEIPVNLPEAGSSKEKKSLNTLTISLTPDGRVFLRGKEVSSDKLKETIKSAPDNTRIEIRADREVRMETFVKLIDLLNSLGRTSINLTVIKE